MFLWSCHNKNERMLKQCCEESNILQELEAKVANLNREVDGSRGEERRNSAETNSLNEEVQVLQEQMNNQSLRNDKPLQEGGHTEEREQTPVERTGVVSPSTTKLVGDSSRPQEKRKKLKGTADWQRSHSDPLSNPESSSSALPPPPMSPAVRPWTPVSKELHAGGVATRGQGQCTGSEPVVSVTSSIPVVNLESKDKPGMGGAGRVSPPLGVARMGNLCSPIGDTHYTLTVEGCDTLRRNRAIPMKGDLIREHYLAKIGTDPAGREENPTTCQKNIGEKGRHA